MIEQTGELATTARRRRDRRCHRSSSPCAAPWRRAAGRRKRSRTAAVRCAGRGPATRRSARRAGRTASGPTAGSRGGGSTRTSISAMRLTGRSSASDAPSRTEPCSPASRVGPAPKRLPYRSADGRSSSALFIFERPLMPLSLGLVVELVAGAAAGAPMRAQAAAPAGRDVVGGRAARLAGLAVAGPLLVDGPGGDLLGGVLGPASIEQPLLDVLVLPLALVAPGLLWHVRLLPTATGQECNSWPRWVWRRLSTGSSGGTRCVGFPIAVLYKFFDDQGVYLAALITYYGFLSLFPLLLLLASVLGFVLARRPRPAAAHPRLDDQPVPGDRRRAARPERPGGQRRRPRRRWTRRAVRRARRRPGAAERHEHRLGRAAQPIDRTRSRPGCAAC